MSGRGSMFERKRFLAVFLALALGLMLAVFVSGKPASGAGTLPAGFTQTRFADGLVSPTAMAFAPDGRLYVAEQRGTLRVVDQTGQLQEKPFFDVSGKVSPVGERGLLGVAFDPAFATDNYVYVYYTLADGTTPVHNCVARFTATVDGSGNVVAAAGSERPIFDLPSLGATNHNGGAIHFGNDGKLYVAVGENGRPAEAQSLNSLLGKMLRINKDGTIPADNPFFNATTGDNKAIWALGLRNPYSFDLQPGTGRIFINDVGQNTWEEINDGIAGTNYGWPYYEGPATYQAPPRKGKHGHKKHGKRGASPYTGPLLYAYSHGAGCAITGGAFYDPQTLRFPPEYEGDYFFADFCAGWIDRFDPGTKQATTFKSASDEQPVDLKVSEGGDLYFLARGTGSVEKISYTPPTA